MKSDNQHISIFGYINHLYQYVLNLKIFDQVLPKRTTNSKKENSKSSNKSTNTLDLFPKTINYQQDLLNGSTIKPCSVEVSKFNKVINPDGTISWDINSDNSKDNNNNNTTNINSNTTSPFLTSTGSTISTGDEFSPNGLKFPNTKDTPSPYNINEHFHKSDEDSTHSLEDILPDLPDPDFFDIANKETANSSTSSSSSSSSTGSKKIYTCEFCHAEFRIRGYLTRHIKKHAINKAYECPFFNPQSDNKCHPNGGFSRRDTYKTHLKACHFKYPQGTRSQDRPNTPGKCGMCGKSYMNNEDWVEHHIENGECERLPQGYEGRVKNSRRRNYEFPTSTVEENASGHSSGNDDMMSPNTGENSPDGIQNIQQQQMKNNGHVNLPVQGNNHSHHQIQGKFGLPVVIGNDYDENDEYSLDTEQCFSFYR